MVEGQAAISDMMELSKPHHNACPMDANKRELIMQRWGVIQNELMPELRHELGALTPKLEAVIRALEWVRIEEFIEPSWCGLGRPPHERAWFANAFVAKALLGITHTRGPIERLTMDRALRRICGFPMCKQLPSEASFSRAFGEFSDARLAERTHEVMIKSHLGDELIGHVSRDATAIHARERSRPSGAPTLGEATATLGDIDSTESIQSAIAIATATATATAATQPTQHKHKRGRPRRGELRPAAALSPLARQREQSFTQMIGEMPRHCDRGTQCNAQGYKVSWNGYKLHLDTADCGVPIAAILSSASMHDSFAAIPLSILSGERVTHLYDVMDAAYCSSVLREHSRSLGHVALIDHNPRAGVKIEFDPAEATRYNERTVAERTNARLKDEFGGNSVNVKGAVKLMSQLMFGVLCLAADQLMRLQI